MKFISFSKHIFSNINYKLKHNLSSLSLEPDKNATFRILSNMLASRRNQMWSCVFQEEKKCFMPYSRDTCCLAYFPVYFKQTKKQHCILKVAKYVILSSSSR